MVEIHRRQKPFMWMERSSKFGIVLMHPEWSVIGRAICTVRNGTKKSSKFCRISTTGFKAVEQWSSGVGECP
ncbi:MAG: hypothetical protein PUP93_02125 [Rhizonema sp. NSF051]|nr:hypothetical protein [Rhizonema sp. NSF051]